MTFVRPARAPLGAVAFAMALAASTACSGSHAPSASPTTAAPSSTAPTPPRRDAAALAAYLDGRTWSLSLDDSPNVVAHLKEACAPPDAPAGCMPRLRGQAAREGLGFEKSRAPSSGGEEPEVDLLMFDGDTAYKRLPYGLRTTDGVSFELSGRRAADRMLMMLDAQDRLHVEDPKHGMVVYVPRPRAAIRETPLPAGPQSAWTELELGPVNKSGDQPIKRAPVHTPKTALGVFPGGVSPEAAVTHYLASRMRKDDRYREVLSTSVDDRRRSIREEHERHLPVLESFQLVSHAETMNGSVIVMVKIRMRDGGKELGGDYEFIATREAGVWRLIAEAI